MRPYPEEFVRPVRLRDGTELTDNPRMIAVFEKRGFRIVNDLESSLVEVSKELV